jgi:polyketide cyclase/dehydrase/lipid transport protein
VTGGDDGLMASIRTELVIDADAAHVWKTIGDWENGPADMAPGLVVSSHAEGPVRVVTFADGRVVRERLVTRDDDARRIVYSVIGDTMRPDHDNAVMHVISDGEGRCRFVWSRDVLPDELAEPLLAAMRGASAVIKRTFEDR